MAVLGGRIVADVQVSIKAVSLPTEFMMRACRSVGSVLSLVLPIGIVAAFTGCQPAPAPPPPPMAPAVPAVSTPSSSDRTSLDVFPGTKAVAVVQVRSDPSPDLCQAALKASDPTGIKEKDIVTYVDRQQNVIANGQVTSITMAPDNTTAYLTATYEPIAAGRAPRPGDWALIRPPTH